jgi:hypothetical protein
MTASGITWDMTSVRTIAKPHDENGVRQSRDVAFLGSA